MISAEAVTASTIVTGNHSLVWQSKQTNQQQTNKLTSLSRHASRKMTDWPGPSWWFGKGCLQQSWIHLKKGEIDFCHDPPYPRISCELCLGTQIPLVASQRIWIWKLVYRIPIVFREAFWCQRNESRPNPRSGFVDSAKHQPGRISNPSIALG